jgi:hypothetical protein
VLKISEFQAQIQKVLLYIYWPEKSTYSLYYPLTIALFLIVCKGITAAYGLAMANLRGENIQVRATFTNVVVAKYYSIWFRRPTRHL